MTEHPEILARLERKLDHLLQEVHRMAVDQATFDTDLAALVTAVEALIAAVKAPSMFITAEDQAVINAANDVNAELQALNPTPPTPTRTAPTRLSSAAKPT